MANWLEEEERKREIERQNFRLEWEKQMQREEDALSVFIRFHDICNRVNNLRSKKIEIDRLRVNGPIRHIETNYLISDRLTGKSRSVNISCQQENTIIEAIVVEHFDIDRDEYSDGPWEGSHPIILRKHICSIQDLNDWTENNMLEVIRWLLNEIDEVKNFLPGYESMNAEGRIIVRLERRQNKDPNQITVFIDEKSVRVVRWSDSTNFGQKGCVFDISTGSHVLTVADGENRTSKTFNLVAGQVAIYEVSFSYFGGIRLNPV